MEGRCVLAPETGIARLPTVDRRTSSTARRWEAEDRNRCLDVMSARPAKHDCSYPGTVPLQIRWTAVDVVSCDVHVVIDRQGTSGTFRQTFMTLLIRVHSENDSRIYVLIMLTTDYN